MYNREFIFDPDTDDYEYQQNQSYLIEAYAWPNASFNLYLKSLYDDGYQYDCVD